MDIGLLYNTENGKLIKEHLENSISELNSVTDIKGDDPFAIAVQTEARKLAISMLHQILFTTQNEETNKKEINKERFGL
ncbi:MAG TPA: hypothetical protein PLB93_02220 [Candidatus Paceibacterota bacterium]|nr:hypothetical protein [Candidatus Paceibacterota bacterium]